MFLIGPAPMRLWWASSAGSSRLCKAGKLDRGFSDPGAAGVAWTRAIGLARPVRYRTLSTAPSAGIDAAILNLR